MLVRRGFFRLRRQGYRPLRGLGLVRGSCCPHYSEEPARRPAFEAAIASGSIFAGLAIDDGVACPVRWRRSHRLLQRPSRSRRLSTDACWRRGRQPAHFVSRVTPPPPRSIRRTAALRPSPARSAREHEIGPLRVELDVEGAQQPPLLHIGVEERKRAERHAAAIDRRLRHDVGVEDRGLVIERRSGKPATRSQFRPLRRSFWWMMGKRARSLGERIGPRSASRAGLRTGS